MGLIRFLILALVFWLLFRLFRRYWDKLPRNNRPRANIDNIVRCEHCGVHVPQKEALEHNGKYYCSKAHQLAGKDS